MIYGKKQPDTNIPQHEIEALARCLLPEIQKFFERPEGQKEFASFDTADGANTKYNQEGMKRPFIRNGQRITARQIAYVLEKYAERQGATRSQFIIYHPRLYL